MPEPKSRLGVGLATEKRAHLLSLGYDAFMFFIIVSDIDEAELYKLASLLHSSVSPNLVLQLISTEKPFAISRPLLKTYRLKDANVGKTVYQENLIEGSYLQLGIAYRKTDGARIESILNSALGLTSLLFGHWAAWDIHHKEDYNLTNNQSTVHSEPTKMIQPLHSPLRTGTVANFDHSSFKFKINFKSLEILSLAMSHHDNLLRFFLIWLALEIQVPGKVTKSTGERRREFCLSELKSTKISFELQRLHKLRSAAFKSDTTIRISTFDEHVLLSFIRLACMPSGEARRNLVLDLQADIDLGQVRWTEKIRTSITQP